MTYGLKGYSNIDACRTCESHDLIEILDLGKQPLANELKQNFPLKPENRYPLVFIGCEKCKQLQLSVNVDPELMFKNYSWVTGTSNTSKNHCNSLAKIIDQKINLKEQRILEIGSNDGTLLKLLKQSNSESVIIGVDPAQNLFEDSENFDIKIYRDFFDEKFANNFINSQPHIDILIARNVFSHVPDLRNVFRGVDLVTHKDSILIIEFHTATTILNELHYDSIYHEHTYYHTINSFTVLLNEIGYHVNDLVSSPISGGSNIIFASRKKLMQSKDLKSGLKLEEEIGVRNKINWANFAKRVKNNILLNKNILQNLKNYDSCAYGASARSSTLLNATDTTRENLSAIADLNPLKWGKLSPGLHIPIDNPEIIINSQIKNVFICAFNFENEIIERLKRNFGWSGNIFVPLPNRPRHYVI